MANQNSGNEEANQAIPLGRDPLQSRISELENLLRRMGNRATSPDFPAKYGRVFNSDIPKIDYVVLRSNTIDVKNYQRKILP